MSTATSSIASPARTRATASRRSPRCTWRLPGRCFLSAFIVPLPEFFPEQRDLERALSEQPLEVAHLQAQVLDLLVRRLGWRAPREIRVYHVAVCLAPVVEDVDGDAVPA